MWLSATWYLVSLFNKVQIKWEKHAGYGEKFAEAAIVSMFGYLQ
jgi:hypothetical protein